MADFKEGDTVRIKAGAFAAHAGRVEELLLFARALKVAVSIFGRRQVIELRFEEVEKVSFTQDSKTRAPGK